MNQRTIFDVKECKEYLHIKDSLIRKLVKESKIPYFRLGSKIMFNKESIDLWIHNQEIENQMKYNKVEGYNGLKVARVKGE